MTADTSTIPAALDLILVSRNLERIADGVGQRRHPAQDRLAHGCHRPVPKVVELIRTPRDEP